MTSLKSNAGGTIKGSPRGPWWVGCIALIGAGAWLFIIIAILILLSGCAPMAGPTSVGPADPFALAAGRTVEAATVVAAAEATAIAQTTAAWRQTQDSLSVESTRAAWPLTESAAWFQATNAASGATATARMALDDHQRASDATNVAATTTLSAVQTAAALDASEAADRQSRSRSAAEFWEWFRVLTLSSIAGLSLVLCVLILTRGIIYIRAEDRALRAKVAREAFQVLSNGYWAEYDDTKGYNVYQLPAPANPGVIDIATVAANQLPTQANHLLHWKHALRMFCWHGERHGFGIRTLGAAGLHVVSDPEWRALVKILKGAEVLAVVPVKGEDGKTANTTTWAENYSYARFAHELAEGKIALALPTDKAPPNVAFTVPNTTPQPA